MEIVQEKKMVLDNIQSQKENWIYFLVAAFFPFYAFIQMNNLNTLGTSLIQNNIIEQTSLGFLSAIYIYTSAALFIPIGILLDRYSVKHLLLCGAILCTAGAFLFGLSQSFSMLIAARFVSGAGHAFAFLCCFRLVSNLFTINHQARMIGLVVTIALLGGALTQTPFLVLSQKIDWHILLWMNAFLGFLLVLTMFYVLPNKENHLKNKKITVIDDLSNVIKNSQNWIAGLYTCVMGVPLMILGALWGTLYVSEIKNISLLEASWSSSAIFLGTILGSPFAGWLADRVGRYKTVMLGGALLSLFFLITFLALESVHPIFYATLLFILSFCSGTQIIGYAIILRSNAEKVQGAAMGFANVIIMAGLASFQILFGWIFSHHLEKSYTSIMLTFLLIAAAIISTLINRTRKSEHKSCYD